MFCYCFTAPGFPGDWAGLPEWRQHMIAVSYVLGAEPSLCFPVCLTCKCSSDFDFDFGHLVG